MYDSRFMYESIYIFFLNCILYNEKLKTCAYITGHEKKRGGKIEKERKRKKLKDEKIRTRTRKRK